MLHAHARTLAPAQAFAAQGFALASPASAPRPEAARIAALSSAIALNLLLFGIIMLPISLPPPLASTPPPRIQLRIIPRTPVIPVVPVQPPRALPKPTTTSPLPVVRPHATTAVTTTTSIPTNTGDQFVAEDTQPTDDTSTIDSVATIDSAPVQLAYRAAPPPAYPRSAMRMGLGGTVLLRILVDTDGHPLQVTIERSSGHRELDDAARDQVLAHWLFQPAIINGAAVRAVGLVPIAFQPRR